MNIDLAHKVKNMVQAVYDFKKALTSIICFFTRNSFSLFKTQDPRPKTQDPRPKIQIPNVKSQKAKGKR